MRMRPTLTQDDVALMVAACHAKEKELGRTGTIAIVDFGGDLLFLIRPDKQSPNSVDVAVRKAQTAAFRERPSSNLEARVKERPGWLMFPNGLPMSGGVPLFYQGECVGGIAVSGIAEDDEVVALAGSAAFEAAQREVRTS
jgi:glc operon protein GlcG